MKDDGLHKLLENIGAVVKKYRKQNKISQFDLGLEIGKSANQIGRIERAESNPTVETLYDLAFYFEVDIKDFFR